MNKQNLSGVEARRILRGVLAGVLPVTAADQSIAWKVAPNDDGNRRRWFLLVDRVREIAER